MTKDLNTKAVKDFHSSLFLNQFTVIILKELLRIDPKTIMNPHEAIFNINTLHSTILTLTTVKFSKDTYKIIKILKDFINKDQTMLISQI